MLEKLTTERRNPKTTNLDQLTPHEFLKIMNEEDKKVPLVVEEVLPDIEKAVKVIIKSLEKCVK